MVLIFALGYAMYLTHETKEAIDEAKELYSVDELSHERLQGPGIETCLFAG